MRHTIKFAMSWFNKSIRRFNSQENTISTSYTKLIHIDNRWVASYPHPLWFNKDFFPLSIAHCNEFLAVAQDTIYSVCGR